MHLKKIHIKNVMGIMANASSQVNAPQMGFVRVTITATQMKISELWWNYRNHKPLHHHH